MLVKRPKVFIKHIYKDPVTQASHSAKKVDFTDVSVFVEINSVECKLISADRLKDELTVQLRL